MASAHIVRPRKKLSNSYKVQKRAQQLVSAFDTQQDYYAINAHPPYSLFGVPDFVDGEGREYRLAFTVYNEPRSPLYSVMRLRASDDGVHVDDTMDDYLRHAAREAKERNETLELLPVHPGTTGRTRLWIRLPKKRRDADQGPVSWPATSHELDTRLTYIGDPSIVDANEMAVLDVIIQTTMCSAPNRKTGYVDVSGLDTEIASVLLRRRVKRITGLLD